MTPELRELLKRHPAPWVIGGDRLFRDATGVSIKTSDYDTVAYACIELINAAAAERDAWEID